MHIRHTLTNWCAAVPMAVALCFVAGAAPAHAGTVDAIEFYHAEMDHYFLTASPEEAAILDEGTRIKGWKRTGLAFKVETTQVAGTAPVCRFYSAIFSPKSSHFYTAEAGECAWLKGGFDWQFEGIAFYAYIPDFLGECAAGQTPVYRFYNQGFGEAPNHRFTTDAGARAQMAAKRWIPEGKNGIALCATGTPPVETTNIAQTKGQILQGKWTFEYNWKGPKSETFNFTNVYESNVTSTPWFVSGRTLDGKLLAVGGFNMDMLKMRLLASVLGLSNNFYVFDFTDLDHATGCFYNAATNGPDPTTGPCTVPMTAKRAP